MRIPFLIFSIILTLSAQAFALEGHDHSVGDPCVLEDRGTAVVTADPDFDLTNVILVCDGSQWVSAQFEAPLFNGYMYYLSGGQIANSYINRYTNDNIGIHKTPYVKLDIAGTFLSQNLGSGCNANTEGVLRYDSATLQHFEYCDGTAWQEFDVAPPRNSWDRGYSGDSIYHQCRLLSSGEAYCWGANNYGQLGTSDNTTYNIPTAVVSGYRYRFIKAAYHNTCAIRDDGRGYCWGYGGGNGNAAGGYVRTNFTSPNAMVGGKLFRHMAGGNYGHCAIGDDGTGYCWGNANGGALCSISGGHQNKPDDINGGHVWRKITDGDQTSCGITEDGTAYCWGSDSSGQRGDGSASGSCPFPVAGGHTFVDIATGASHSCAIDDSGDAYCWGVNTYGQLGDGSTTQRNSPVAVLGGHKFIEIDAGSSVSCGVTANGDIYCWGSGSYVGAASAGTSPQTTPVKIDADVKPSTLDTVTSGNCYVKADDGVYYCFGFGQMGTGTYTSGPVPVAAAIP